MTRTRPFAQSLLRHAVSRLSGLLPASTDSHQDSAADEEQDGHADHTGRDFAAGDGEVRSRRDGDPIVEEFDGTGSPPVTEVPEATAVLVTAPAVTSACVVRHVAVQSTLEPGASDAAPGAQVTAESAPVPENFTSMTLAFRMVTLPVLVILKLLPVLLGPAATALALVTTALSSLDAMDKGSPWITLFDRRGTDAKAVGFQIVACAPAATGAVALDGGDFRIHVARTMTQVLFFKFENSSASLYRRQARLELSERAMAMYGPAIQAKVDAWVLGDIAAFPVPTPPAP